MNTDKPHQCYNYGLWFISIFFSFSRRNAFLIWNSILLLPNCSFSQCADKLFFKEKITAIYNSSAQKPAEKLNKLLETQRQMKDCNLSSDSSFMFLLQKTGVLYYEQADYVNAIEITKESIQVANKNIADNPGSMLALVHNYSNLFYYYNKTGEYKKKFDAVDSCILYALKSEEGFDRVIEPLGEKTDYLFNKGEYSLCSKNAKLGEDIIQKYFHGKDSITSIVFFVMKEANALYFSKNLSGAEQLLKDKILQFKQTGNEKQLYAFYSLLGLIKSDNKNFTEALALFKQAYQTSSGIKYRNGCAQNLAFAGTVYARHFNKANIGLSYCKKALNYAEGASDSLSIFQQIASIYVLKGQYEKAQYFFQEAFNTVQKGMDEAAVLKNTFQFPGFNLLQYLSDLITSKADAYTQQFYKTKNESFINKALSIYKKNDLFLAKIKTEQQLNLASNLVWRTTARNLYEHAIEACFANNNIEDAFYFFEKSRAILLNDQINEERWMSDIDIVKQAHLKKEIIDLERTLAVRQPSSEEYLLLQKKIYSSYQKLEVLTDSIKNKNPAFYQNYLDTSFITIEQVRKDILNNAKTLVEIFSGDSAVYVLTIAPNSQSFLKLNKQLYDSLGNLFNSLITNAGNLNKKISEFEKVSHQLYNLLFQNKAPLYGSLIISPDGISYPFEALIININKEQPDYFLNYYATSYTYSAKYLTNQFALNKTANSVLGMAPVHYNYQNLAELTGSDLSLKTIHNYFPNTTNYVLENAAKNTFINAFPGYSIIQLYTHAAGNSINNEPVIYFADSALYLSDLIPNRKPVTQLVILSACETASGKLYEGEGIFSFNRGFAALGIPAAISNLWSADNESTYRITELFYKFLSKGLPTDVALQKAKLEFIKYSSSKEKKLPYFWASAVLTGKVNVFKVNSNFSWKYIIAGGVTLLVIIFLAIKLFKKHNQTLRTSIHKNSRSN